ncbi:MAG: hypothetical protein JWO13_2723 [Acidobacteriales bacterium]|nr:hypothetical protein [Terriglobales bacterium]
MPNGQPTQAQRILSRLNQTPNHWVPLPVILEMGIAQYSARIHELRAEGHNIENRTERIDGVRYSWFRIVPATPGSVPPESTAPTPPSTETPEAA